MGRSFPAGAFISALVIIGAFALPQPDEGGAIAHLPALCPFHALTGLPCPLCGLTRSIVCCAHGHLAQSFAFHPLGPLAFCACFPLMIIGLLAAVRPELAPPLRANRNRYAAMSVVAALVLCWIARLAGLDPLPA